jgi:hypothetical protein
MQQMWRLSANGSSLLATPPSDFTFHHHATRSKALLADTRLKAQCAQIQRAPSLCHMSLAVFIAYACLQRSFRLACILNYCIKHQPPYVGLGWAVLHLKVSVDISGRRRAGRSNTRHRFSWCKTLQLQEVEVSEAILRLLQRRYDHSLHTDCICQRWHDPCP